MRSLFRTLAIAGEVFDKKSGIRFQLSNDEKAALKPLTTRKRNGNTPLEVAIAFDHAANAMMNRRRGYCFEGIAWPRERPENGTAG